MACLLFYLFVYVFYRKGFHKEEVVAESNLQNNGGIDRNALGGCGHPIGHVGKGTANIFALSPTETAPERLDAGHTGVAIGIYIQLIQHVEISEIVGGGIGRVLQRPLDVLAEVFFVVGGRVAAIDAGFGWRAAFEFLAEEALCMGTNCEEH